MPSASACGDLIRGEAELKNGIIFCNRKRDVALLQKSLVSHGFDAAALHGDMDQRARTTALDAFRNGETALLVASDVAARGLDIPAVSHVFNFDVPHHPEDYVHRIGRTGRAGRSGTAYTLVAPEDTRSLGAIEALIGQPIPWFDGDLRRWPSPSATPARVTAAVRARAAAARVRQAGPPPGRQEPARDRGRPRRAGPRRRRAADRRAASRESRAGARPEAARRGAPSGRAGVASAARPDREERGRRPEPDGDTPVGLGSHVPAFLLRPVLAKKEK